MPEKYREWKNNAIAELTAQYHQLQPIELTEIHIELHGKQRGDLDNIAGSILDALVQSKILKDDRIGIVSALSIRHFPQSKLPYATVTLTS